MKMIKFITNTKQTCPIPRTNVFFILGYGYFYKKNKIQMNKSSVRLAWHCLYFCKSSVGNSELGGKKKKILSCLVLKYFRTVHE